MSKKLWDASSKDNIGKIVDDLSNIKNKLRNKFADTWVNMTDEEQMELVLTEYLK